MLCQEMPHFRMEPTSRVSLAACPLGAGAQLAFGAALVFADSPSGMIPDWALFIQVP